MHIQLDSDNLDKIEAMSRELDVSVGWLVNTLLRNVKRAEIHVSVEQDAVEIRTKKAVLRIRQKTSWVTRI
jgi:hypothetical protein